MRILLTKILSFFNRGTDLFIPSAQSSYQHSDRVLVLSSGDIPTTQIYLKKRLHVQFGEEVCYVDTRRTSPQEIVLDNNCMVIIVRHVPRNWLRWLSRNQKQLDGVVFLMDDDIPASLNAPELPLRYAIKTAWRYQRSRKLLSQVCTEVWLSTPELMQRYAGSFPQLLEPEYVAPRPLGNKSVTYFYHGSWAHRREIEWLVPIVRQVQEAVPNAWFEIIGTDRVRHLFKSIPRVRIVHPMPWQDYLAYAGTVRYQLGLAPCFDTDFNRARSHSKAFDITRLGAAGIYSNVTPYAEKVVHGKTGFLCANDQDEWVAALALLLKDEELRTALYLAAKAWCENSRSHHSIKSNAF